MKRVLSLFVLLAPGLALATPSRAEVERLLSGYELPATAADFKRLGEGTDRVLVDIAADPATHPARTLRALAALSFVPTTAGRDHCRRVIRDEGSADAGLPVLQVAACAHTLGAFGPAMAPELEGLLSHPSAEVRQGAVRGIEASGAAASVPVLKRQLAVEPDASVRQRLEQAVRTLAKAR